MADKSKDFNPFRNLHKDQDRVIPFPGSVKQEEITTSSHFSPFHKPVKQEDITTAVVPVDITIGDDVIKDLLRAQPEPLTLQEKLKALFSYEQPKDDPFPINARDLYEFIGVTTKY